MAWPTVTLEVGWGAGPLTASPTWTTIPAERVLSVEWEEGRKRALEDDPPAQATVVLDNSGRWYDPDNTSSPHAGDLNPRVPLRFTVGGVRQFVMFVEDGWEQELMPPATAVVRLRCVDRTGALQGTAITHGPYASQVRALSPSAYWPLDEQPGSAVMTDQSGRGHHGRYDEVELGRSSLGAGLGAAARFAHVGDWRGTHIGPVITGFPVSWSAWVRIDRDPTEAYVITAATPSRLWAWSIWSVEPVADDPVGSITWNYLTPGTQRRWRGSRPIADGQPHHVAVVAASATSVNIYVDGVLDTATLITSTGSPSNVWPDLNVWAVGNMPEMQAGDFGVAGDVSDVAVWQSGLSASDVASLYAAGRDAWANDRTGARAIRVLDLMGVPSGLRTVDAGESILGAASDIVGDGMDYLRKVVRTEQGRLFAPGWNEGRITITSRYRPLTDTRATVSQATVSDDPAATGVIRAEEIMVVANGMGTIINQAAVSWTGGTEVVTVNPQYGVRSQSVDTASTTPGQARGIGEWLTTLRGSPRSQVEALTFSPVADPAGWDLARDVRVGDRITLRRQPLATGSVQSADWIVEGRSVSLAGHDVYDVTLYLSPVTDVSFGRWDVSRWDTGRWAY